MPPKQTKKTITDNASASSNDNNSEASPNLISIKKEWIDNVNEIISIREKLVILEKRNEELVNKIWEIMNKNPSEQVIIDSIQKEEPKSTKSKKSEEQEDSETKPKVTKASVKSKAKPEIENDDIDTKPKASATKAPVKSKAKSEVETDDSETKSKASATKASVKSKAKPDVEEDDEKPSPVPVKKATPAKKVTEPVVVKKKISALPKGTPKPKPIESDDEKPKPNLNDDSDSDTEVDSLSSVSDESDISGGEDD
jgi:hypothetical protein